MTCFIFKLYANISTKMSIFKFYSYSNNILTNNEHVHAIDHFISKYYVQHIELT